jgi:formylmethanofuran--tetrahydromethanopterin N-formyltransferase
MQLGSTRIEDTFAEAFAMWGARVVVTALTPEWALAAAQSMTGFATSVIGCKCEAGIERMLAEHETPDGRPGASILVFAMDKAGLGKRLLERIGQCVMTCPTTACFSGLPSDQEVIVGGKLRYFGDGFQISKVLNGTRYWRIPVMDGEFLVQERFGMQPSVGGGNLILCGTGTETTVAAAGAAVTAIRALPDVILPFPGGVVRSGSKVGSRYRTLPASTNDAFCPTLRAVSAASSLASDINCALEIVIDGLTEGAVRNAMAAGMKAAARPGLAVISAGNYGGNLGQFRIPLHSLLDGSAA